MNSRIIFPKADLIASPTARKTNKPLLYALKKLFIKGLKFDQ